MPAMMARLCLLIATLLFVLVTAGPVEKRFGVSLPLKRGVSRASGGANIDRRKRSDSSPVVADLRKQLARVKHIYGDGSVLAPSLHKRGISKSINLTDTGKDYTYFTSIQVGTPPQTFNVQISTILADFWIASKYVCCSNTTVTRGFDSRASSTWVNSTEEISVPVSSTTNITAWIGDDTVSLGDFKVEKQGMGVVEFVPDEAGIADPLSGIIGFGWQSVAYFRGLPWWQHLMSRGILQEPLFGLYIARHLLESYGGAGVPGGSLDLGFANPLYYTGAITYSNVTAQRLWYWEVAVQSLTIGGHLVEAGNSIAVLDPGTAWMSAPSDVARGLYALVPGATPGKGKWNGYYTVPCDTNVTAGFYIGERFNALMHHPQLSFTIDGVNYPVSLADWIVSFGSLCLGTIFPFDVNHDVATWVLGGAFLKNVYSVYRYNPPSVGLAQLSPAVRYAGTGTSPTSSIPLGEPSSTVTTSISITTVYVPPPQTSRGAGSGGAELRGKAVLPACISALMWIMSHMG